MTEETEETAGTPRTDAAAISACDGYVNPTSKMADFARQLEREVAALTTQRDDKDALIESLEADNLSWLNRAELAEEALQRTAAYKFDRDLKRLEDELVNAVTRAEAAEAQRDEKVQRLHGLIEQLAGRFEGYLPYPDEKRDSVVRGHEMFIKDTIKKADAIAEAQRDELQKRIDTAVPVAEGGANINQWIPVSEKLPAVGQAVLVSYFTWKDSTKPRGYTVGMRDQFNTWKPAVPRDDIDDLYPPTHWMPFQEPETGTAQETECETNETEGLRAELDAAKRALAGITVEQVEAALLDYRCQYWVDAEDEGSHMSLVDILSPPGSADIKLGREEIELLADHVTAALAAKSPLG